MNGADFYGIQHILLRHAGLPDYGVFPFSVQHGWQYAATRFEADAHPLEIWVWSERSRHAISAFFPIDQIRVIGSPYLYLEAVDPQPPSRSSLYVLPHSSHLARVGFSRDRLLQLLRDIGGDGMGCDVLAYYLDVNDELCQALRTVNSRILVNGGLWSVDFMKTLRRNIHLYEHIYYSGFGSAVLFARYERRQTTYIALDSQVESSSNKYVDRVSQESVFDPTGSGMDTDAELGVEHRTDSQKMREWILDGFRAIPSLRLASRAVNGVRARFRDYRMNVRPSLQLAERHNAEVDRRHA